MENLHCPKCHSNHVIVQTRRRYFKLALLCMLIVAVCYLILRNPMLDPGELNLLIMMVSITFEAVFCIALIMAVYFLISGILQKHASYFCRECHHHFEHGLIAHHHVHRHH